jgi:hypothetical protein
MSILWAWSHATRFSDHGALGRLQSRSRRKLSRFVRPWILTVALVEPSMASRAKRDQIRILIRAPLTSQLLVVNL